MASTAGAIDSTLTTLWEGECSPFYMSINKSVLYKAFSCFGRFYKSLSFGLIFIIDDHGIVNFNFQTDKL